MGQKYTNRSWSVDYQSVARRKAKYFSAKGRRRFGEEKAEVRRKEGGGSAKPHHCSPTPALRADPPPPRGGINYN